MLQKLEKKSKREKNLGEGKEKSVCSQMFGSSPYLPASGKSCLLTDETDENK